MKRRSLSIFLILTMLLMLLPDFTLTAAADGMPWNGSGTENDPYLISAKEDLWALSDISNSGEDLTGVHFRQTADIDLMGIITERSSQGKAVSTENTWTPVSATTKDGVIHQFTGVYDGGGHKILNMVVDKGNDDAGFFGYIGKGGMLRYVNVIDGYVNGSYWAGGMAGRSCGTIEYCSFSGDVYGAQDFAGGIVGDNHTGGVLRYCCTVKRTTPILINGFFEDDMTYVSGKQICGGIAGRNSTGSAIENCCNTAYVFTEDGFIHNIGGGITGKNEGNSTVENCCNSGCVEDTGNVTNNVGAIVGVNSDSGTVHNCCYETDSVYRGEDQSNGEGLDGAGTNFPAGNADKVEEKTLEEFESGEVAWELFQSEGGGDWGQNLNERGR